MDPFNPSGVYGAAIGEVQRGYCESIAEVGRHARATRPASAEANQDEAPSPNRLRELASWLVGLLGGGQSAQSVGRIR